MYTNKNPTPPTKITHLQPLSSALDSSHALDNSHNPTVHMSDHGKKDNKASTMFRSSANGGPPDQKPPPDLQQPSMPSNSSNTPTVTRGAHPDSRISTPRRSTSTSGAQSRYGGLHSTKEMGPCSTTSSPLSAPAPQTDVDFTGSKNHKGAIVGGVVGGVMSLVLLIFAGFLFLRRRRRRRVLPPSPVEYQQDMMVNNRTDTARENPSSDFGYGWNEKAMPERS
ncbi:hypothetical protein PM082_009487 [Marasmius tenuissimus]|nr:hypothetical protein PM082_009487 [Marasmius tenuissimus]